MSTSTLELIELDVNLDEKIPCLEHTDRDATHRLSHDGCSFFMCTPCAKNCQQVVDSFSSHLQRCRRPDDHKLECSVCTREINFLTVTIRPLGD